MVRLLIAASAVGLAYGAWAGAAPPVEGSPYRMVGDHTSVYGFQRLRVEGIGLVVGLPKTGGDTPPGLYREEILKLMRHNEVENPEKLLASKTVATVLLKSHVPPGARKGDMVDVEVMVLPNDNETTSLHGGYLLPVNLSENITGRSKLMTGDAKVVADGPILVKDSNSAKKDENATKVGRILGRGRIKDDRNFIITINKEHRSSRMAKEMGVAINGRFSANNEHGNQKGIASAKTDQEIHITVPPQYKHNVVRFLHVCRRLPFRVPEARRTALIRELKQDLMDPAKAYEAALRFEALGPLAVSHLKEGLSSQSQIVRFSAAESLAYLGDARGLKELATLAENDSLYRAYAIAALASPRLPQAHLMLTKLLHAPGAETRYGAFRALSMLEKNDPMAMGEKLGDDCTLHVITSNAEPMVHVASHFKPEIVVFGKGQKLAPPVMLRVAEHLIVQHEGMGEKIILTSIRPGKPPLREECSPEIAEVIRKAAKIGAKYPDLVELLRQAAASGCLQSRLEINALPKAASMAALAQGNDEDAQQLPTGLPSLFEEDEGAQDEPRRRTPDVAKKEEPPKKKPWWKFSLFGN